MQANFKENLKRITDICKFEHWIRFYFAQDKDGKVWINIPEDIMEHIQKEYDNLSEFAEKVNQTEVTPEISQENMISFINTSAQKEYIDEKMIPSVLNSKSFEVEITLFHAWLNAHEDQLEGKVLDFKEWMQLFEAWKRTEKGQNMIKTLNKPSQNQGTDKVQ